MESSHPHNRSKQQDTGPNSVIVGQPNLKDPHVVLSLLETDQVVAAKRQSRFGRRPLSLGIRMLLWGLRGYVVVMLIIVLIAVLRAMNVVR